MSDRRIDLDNMDINRSYEDEMADEIERNLKKTYGNYSNADDIGSSGGAGDGRNYAGTARGRSQSSVGNRSNNRRTGYNNANGYSGNSSDARPYNSAGASGAYGSDSRYYGSRTGNNAGRTGNYSARSTNYGNQTGNYGDATNDYGVSLDSYGTGSEDASGDTKDFSKKNVSDTKDMNPDGRTARRSQASGRSSGRSNPRRSTGGNSSGRKTDRSSSSGSGRTNSPDSKALKAGNGKNVSDKAKKNAKASATKKGKGKNQGDNIVDTTAKGGRNNRIAKKPKSKKKKVFFVLRIIFFLILFAIMITLVVFYLKYGKTIMKWRKEAAETVAASSEETFKSSLTSIIYNSKGNPIAELKGDKDTYYLEYDNIPTNVVNAFVDVEDQGFFKHKGYDIKAIGSATVQLVRSKILKKGISRGGSTITQQLAKLTFLSSEQTLERKIKEIFVSTEMEKKYTKEQILEFYINNVYFANGYYGIESAAQGYFSKSADKLTLAETAFLCAIPNGPTKYDPITNYDNTKVRQKLMLDEMLDQGDISQNDYDAALKENVELNIPSELKTRNYETTYSIYCATKALMKAKGFEFQYSFDSTADRKAYEESFNEMYDTCHQALYTQGYRIYTSIDKSIQKELQDSVDSQLKSFTEKKNKIYTFQGAATCIDNETGKVVAIVGGRSQKSLEGYTLNRAFQSPRQPGSSFKPIAVYTPALERDYTPDTIVDDTYFEGGPRNSSGIYQGKIPLRSAVEQSKNVIAWKVFEELTPKVGLSYVLNMNFAHIVDDDFIPAASLGGLTNGVTTTEMASAYATLANGGKFTDPTCIEKITDAEGNVVVPGKTLTKQKKVYKENAALMMTDILKGVLVQGTAAGHAIPNMDSAGKTGTTSDYKDGWFCGYTPYYSTAVWVGYDQPQTLSGLTGGSYPLSIWYDFMVKANKDKPKKEFKAYKDESGETVTTYSQYTAAPTATSETTETEEDAESTETTTPTTTTDTTGQTGTTDTTGQTGTGTTDTTGQNGTTGTNGQTGTTDNTGQTNSGTNNTGNGGNTGTTENAGQNNQTTTTENGGGEIVSEEETITR
ncbi:MAG: PBP1A family penicillin-binding protein [Lachnospiraceae bacterium]|nr:PBP1A family penicillin-binding protein [Lachnospiraceae bacterium]